MYTNTNQTITWHGDKTAFTHFELTQWQPTLNRLSSTHKHTIYNHTNQPSNRLTSTHKHALYNHTYQSSNWVNLAHFLPQIQFQWKNQFIAIVNHILSSVKREVNSRNHQFFAKRNKEILPPLEREKRCKAPPPPPPMGKKHTIKTNPKHLHISVKSGTHKSQSNTIVERHDILLSASGSAVTFLLWLSELQGRRFTHFHYYYELYTFPLLLLEI